MIWRGWVYEIDLGPPPQAEASSRGLGLVVSNDAVNNGHAGQVTVVPLTATDFGLRSHVRVSAGATGLDRPSFAMCEQVRALPRERILSPRGEPRVPEMEQVDKTLRHILHR
jgi:mRNA interferase MazF